jgi:hypothetical protein
MADNGLEIILHQPPSIKANCGQDQDRRHFRIWRKEWSMTIVTRTNCIAQGVWSWRRDRNRAIRSCHRESGFGFAADEHNCGMGFVRGAVEFVARAYRKAKGDVNQAKNRTFGGIFHDEMRLIDFLATLRAAIQVTQSLHSYRQLLRPLATT